MNKYIVLFFLIFSSNYTLDGFIRKPCFKPRKSFIYIDSSSKKDKNRYHQIIKRYKNSYPLLISDVKFVIKFFRDNCLDIFLYKMIYFFLGNYDFDIFHYKSFLEKMLLSEKDYFVQLEFILHIQYLMSYLLRYEEYKVNLDWKTFGYSHSNLNILKENIFRLDSGYIVLFFSYLIKVINNIDNSFESVYPLESDYVNLRIIYKKKEYLEFIFESKTVKDDNKKHYKMIHDSDFFKPRIKFFSNISYESFVGPYKMNFKFDYHNIAQFLF